MHRPHGVKTCWLPDPAPIAGVEAHAKRLRQVLGQLGQQACAKDSTQLTLRPELRDRAAVEAAMASPQGQATAADLANFAGAGVNRMMWAKRG